MTKTVSRSLELFFNRQQVYVSCPVLLSSVYSYKTGCQMCSLSPDFRTGLDIKPGNLTVIIKLLEAAHSRCIPLL